jgi:hypothetical protein
MPYNNYHHIQLVALALSVLLIIFISVAAFSGQQLTQSKVYMQAQFWVCISYIILYAYTVAMQPRLRLRYALSHIHFLLISIPYLNIISAFSIAVPHVVMQNLHFIPLLRGAYAVIIVMRHLTTTRLMSIFMSYLTIVVLMIYFSSLLIFMREHPQNPYITNYPTALWWCALEFTTIGAPINPVTPTGKVLAAILAAMGVIMFPLFTVYLTQTIKTIIVKPK